jgi:hypothetical protein
MIKKTKSPTISNQIRITKNQQIDNILVALRFKYPLLDDAELIKILIGESGDKYLQMYNNLAKISDDDSGDNIDYSKLRTYDSSQYFHTK